MAGPAKGRTLEEGREMGESRSLRVDRPVLAGPATALRMVALLAAVVLSGPWLDRHAAAQAPTRSGPRFTPNDSEDAERQLSNAANQARNQQWSEAIDIYQRVIDRYGDKVVKLPKTEPGADPSSEFVVYMDGRRYCHRRIAQMPPEAREIYRRRTDPIAERWFRQGAADRDPALLRRVVDQAFCSAWGDDALELLGDLAFQDGRFGEALAAYTQLVADRPDEPFALVHPDPSFDLARVAAKKWLCLAATDRPPGPADLEAFKRRYPGAEGALAGRKGSYANILAHSIADDHLAMPGQPDGRWPTFAGSLRRTRVAPGPIDVGQIQWRVEIEKIAPNRMSGMAMRGGGSTPPQRLESLLAFHPIVLGDQVLLCDGTRVVAYNLGDRPSGSEGGEPRPVAPAWKHDPDGGSPIPRAANPYGSIPRYTLTAVGNRIYVRMGSSSSMGPTFTRRGGFGSVDAGVSSIVALDWSTQGKLLWDIKSTLLDLPHRQGLGTRSISFEGTPVADARSVYVAVTDRGQQMMLYVACFDAESGARRWIRYIGTAMPEIEPWQGGGFGAPMNWGTASGDYRHRLLSLDGSTLYYLTNLGAVIALDAETGATRWVATYPRQDANHFGQTSERDLNPAVVDDGRVLVAPSDADAIFAFDAGSGRLLWKTAPIADDVKLSHVLGVAKGRLVVTGDRVLLFDVKDGKLAAVWPDSASKSLEGYGRGLLAGDLIYWPTRTYIHVLDQRSGLLAGPPIKLRDMYHMEGGNLAAGDGYLIVAQSDGLVVFCQNSRLVDRYRDEIAKAPERAANHYRLARAAEAIGREDSALDSYREAIGRARPDETIDGISLAGAARDHLFRLLMRQAGRLRHEHKWEDATRRLEEAARYARADSERLEARMLLADIHLDAAQPGRAVAELEEVLLDARLRPLPMAADEGRRTIRADLLVGDKLDKIVRQFGRGSYAEYDRRAAALLDRGRKEGDPHLLAELCRDFPAARVVPDALLEMGGLHEASGRLGEAAQAYKRLLAAAADDEQRARALWSTARVYDARKLYVAARDAYLDLAARYPRVALEAGGEPAAQQVEAKLAREPYPRLLADRRAPAIAPPMVRRWSWTAPSDRAVRALTAAGVAPSLEASRVVLADSESLRMLDAAAGSARWSAKLGWSAGWAGFLEDKLIAADDRRVAALDLASGTVQWLYQPSGDVRDSGRPDPFAAAGDDTEAQAERSGRGLHHFRPVKGRVFCLRGPGDLIALDGDTGAVDWSFSAPSGAINPNFWVGPERVVLQVRRPNQLVVLRTDDGRLVSRAAMGESESLERPPLPVDEDSALVVTDSRTVKKLDIEHGQFVWEYRESDVLPVNGAPCPMGGGDLLLLLHEGRTLIRLDPATGAKRWSCPLGLENLAERPGAMAFDDRRFYSISRFSSTVTLRAIGLADGSPAWTSEWITTADDSKWSIAPACDHVFAFPDRAGQREGVEVVWVPVTVRRRQTGALVQRLVFPADGKLAASRLARAGDDVVGGIAFDVDHLGAVVATPRGVWGLGVREAGGPAALDRRAAR
jgi:outer membrane protein assembly factor BamB/tetratricopeptide (TPR) repeat protein